MNEGKKLKYPVVFDGNHCISHNSGMKGDSAVVLEPAESALIRESKFMSQKKCEVELKK